jgi:hypothetical protein
LPFLGAGHNLYHVTFLFIGGKCGMGRKDYSVTEILDILLLT